MSAYVIVEFTVKDPDVYREQYAANAGKTARAYGGEALANDDWELLDGDVSLSSGALMRFPDYEAAIQWYQSPEYQQLIAIRGVAMDARFSLLDGLPAPAEDEGNPNDRTARKDSSDHGRERRDRQGSGPATGITSRDGAHLPGVPKPRPGDRRQRPSLKPRPAGRIFDIVVMDVADLGSVRAGLAAIDGSVDALVMNAGVIGPQSMDLTADGVTTVFATNVLGHVVLLEGLLAEGRLGEVAVFAGSEAVRGVPKLRMKGPSFVSTSADELATVIDGSYFASRKA